MSNENKPERKSKTKGVSFRISWKLWDKIEKLAKQHDSIAPTSQYIRKVLADHVREKENE